MHADLCTHVVHHHRNTLNRYDYRHFRRLHSHTCKCNCKCTGSSSIFDLNILRKTFVQITFAHRIFSFFSSSFSPPPTANKFLYAILPIRLCVFPFCVSKWVFHFVLRKYFGRGKWTKAIGLCGAPGRFWQTFSVYFATDINYSKEFHAVYFVVIWKVTSETSMTILCTA